MAEITDTDELLIRGKLTDMLVTATGLRVIPAPSFFDGIEDFLATDEDISDADKDTQTEIEALDVTAFWIWLVGWEDDTEEPPDSPTVTLRYDILLFAQYDHERADETETPDAFEKLQLKRHNAFVKAALEAKGAFQGQRSLGVLNTNDFAEQYSNPLIVLEPMLPQANCDFVPGVQGHRIKLRENITLKLVAC